MTEQLEKSIAASIERCSADVAADLMDGGVGTSPAGAARYEVIDRKEFHYCRYLQNHGIRSHGDCPYLGEAYITRAGVIFECTAARRWKAAIQ